jgi:hypothetical protein
VLISALLNTVFMSIAVTQSQMRQLFFGSPLDVIGKAKIATGGM